MWRVVAPGAFIQSAASTGGLAIILHLMGWSWAAGIILGMAVSVASTVVMALALAEAVTADETEDLGEAAQQRDAIRRRLYGAPSAS